MDAAALRAALDGFDVDGALERLGNMEDLYIEVLGSFSEEQAGSVAAAREALAAGERDAATRTIHTLKGLAGTVGAEPLRESAEALEAGLRGDTDAASLAPLFDACAAELDAAMVRIGALG